MVIRATRVALGAVRATAWAVLAPIMRFAGLVAAGARAGFRALSAVGERALAATRTVGRLLRRLGFIVLQVVAGPFVGAALVVRARARLLASGGRAVGGGLLHFARWWWRPLAGVGRRLSARLRAVGAGTRSQWRRSREAARGMRGSTRRAFREARRGLRRNLRALTRGSRA